MRCQHIHLHLVNIFKWKKVEESGEKWKKTLILLPDVPNPPCKGIKTMAKAKFFIGKYECKLDDKGRLVFPSELKSQLIAFGEESLVMRKDINMKCLNLYTHDEWREEIDTKKALLDPFDPDDIEMLNGFIQEGALVTPDEKTGRILIPRHILDEIEAIKDMVFVGADKIIKLWTKEEFDKSKAKNTDAKLAATLAERSRKLKKEKE